MNRDDFWRLIEEAGSGSHPGEQAQTIQSKLANRSPEEIIDFERHMTDLLSSSYTWNLWGAAYLICGGCSDDGFDYFRGWLIVQGKVVFEKALAEPDSLAESPNLEENVQCGAILYVASRAHEIVTGTEMPITPINLPDLGNGLDFEDDVEMGKRYPKLFAKFS